MLFHPSMCSSHSRGSYKLSNINIHKLLYFLSPSSSFFHLVKNPSIVPRTLTLFQAIPKSELPGKQTNKKSIFSTAHFICFLSAHSFGFFIGCSCTHVPNVPTNPKLPPVNQCFALTCLEHILTDKVVTMKTKSLDAVEEGKRKEDIVIVLLCHPVIKKLEPDPGCVCASPLRSLLNIVINPQNRFRVN